MSLANILTAAMIATTGPQQSLATISDSSAMAFEQRVSQVVTRAAFDIGSGDTKITVADVNCETHEIIKIWHQSFANVQLQKDLSSSKDGIFSQGIEQKLTHTIQAMQREVSAFKPMQWMGVGTAAIRTAKNGEEFLERVKTATGLEIRMMSQSEEGELGFATAIAVSGETPEDILAWDSGSGSFQISTLIKGKTEIYGADFGYMFVLETLFDNRKQPFSWDLSSSPVNIDEALELIKTIQAILPPTPAWMEGKKKVISFGSTTSIFSVGKTIIGHSPFSKEQVMQSICNLAGKDHDQLELVALILLYAVMDHCKIEQVNYFHSNGNCEGLLIMPRYWQ